MLAFALMLTAVLGVATALQAATVTDASAVAASCAVNGSLVARGARPCFGFGSEGCCKEIGSLTVVAGATGNAPAALVGGLYYIWACT